MIRRLNGRSVVVGMGIGGAICVLTLAAIFWWGDHR